MPRVVLPSELAAKKALAKVEKAAKIEAAFAKLTDKERKLLDIKMANPSIGEDEAARQAGYSITCHSRATTIVKRIQGKIGDVLFMKFGIDEGDIAKGLKDALNATYQRIVTRKTYQDGKVVDEKVELVPIPDHKIRLAAINTLLKYGYTPPAQRVNAKVEHTGQVGLFAQNYAQATEAVATEYEEITDETVQ